jgi:hypothetical protein
MTQTTAVEFQRNFSEFQHQAREHAKSKNKSRQAGLVDGRAEQIRSAPALRRDGARAPSARAPS